LLSHSAKIKHWNSLFHWTKLADVTDNPRISVISHSILNTVWIYL
jgi:hypothetical protein